MDNVDAQSINKGLSDHDGELTQLKHNLMKLTNLSHSVSRSFRDALLRIELDLNTQFSNYNENLTHWRTTIDQVLMHNLEKTKLQDFINFGHNIIAGVQSVILRMSQIKTKYIVLTDLVRQSLSSVRRRSFPVELLSSRDLNQAYL